MQRVRISSDATPLPGGISTSHPYLPFRPIRTHQEVADILGLTKSQVTHSEQLALKKLRILLQQDPRHESPPSHQDPD